MMGATTDPATGHDVQWGHYGWGCSCGAGRDWPLAPPARARAAAHRHLAAVRRREYRQTDRGPR